MSPTEIKSAVRISRIIENLNESLGEAKLENVHIGLAFVEKFKECGITNPTELHNRIAESIGGFLADHLVQDISRYGAISYLLAGRSLVPSLSIALNAVIIDCLFDGLKRFVNVAKKMTTVISGARIRDSYLKVLKVIERNCGRTQSEVRSAGGSEFDFLWKIDPKWIRLNIRKGMVIGGNESRRSGDLDEIDEYLLLRMEEKFAILIQDPQYPIKITLGVLVEGCKNNRKLCSLLRDLPRSREFAEAHIDSPESFLVRVVRYRVKNFNGCEEDAIKETSGMMAVPQDLIRRILDESAELVPDQLSRISHLCTKRRINKARGRARLARRLA
ncbi:hypothetical protein [Paraburkholderia caribensis]|uniref:hypothetical protein n=1 Tax=Paraburkholderia caribensis TaxID=75105 RepID=UPI0031DAACE2